MAEVVNRRLNIFIDQAGADVALEKLTKKENDLVAAIERGKKAGKDLTREMNDLAATRGQIGQLNDVISGKVLPSIRQAEAAVSKFRKELRNIPADSEAAGKKLQDLRRAEATLEAVKNQAYGVSKALKEIGSNQGFLGKIQSGIGGFLSGAGGFLAAGAVGAATVNFLKSSVDEALQAEEATARFRVQLENLGRVDVFERLTKSANDLAKSFGYLDNDEIVGLFEKLIDYGKLTEKQINELTPVIIDFAAKQRVDLATASDVVVKALEGNSKGLKTYGIDITNAKDLTERFGVIMDQLKPKVDGAAKSFGEETAGQIKTTQQSIKNLQEDIGNNMLPFLKKYYEAVNTFTQGIQRLFETGTIFGGETQLGADIRSRKEFLDSLANDFEKQSKERQGRLITGQAASIKTLGEQVKQANGQRKIDLKREFDEEVTLFNKFIELYKKKPDISIVGVSGNANTVTTGGSGKTTAAKNIDDLQKKYQEFSVRTEEATAPILAAFRKINESAKEDLGTVTEALAKGLITQEQADQAFKNIERVLDEQRIELQKKFNLNPIIIPVDIRPTDIEGITNADAKGAGKDIFAKLFNGITKQISDAQKTADDKEKRKKELDDLAQQITDWSFQVSDIYLNLSAARSNAEQAAFDKEVANNNKRKDSAQKLLDQKLISQKEYERRVAKIDKEQEANKIELQKRQFKRDQNAQTVQALMNAAQAVISTLAARPGTLDIISLGAFRAISIGLIAATTASQIAAIRSAKPPQFAEGGFIPDGSSHKQGGISLRDNRTGAVVGEVEGGEPIISKKTYAANKSLIDNLLGSRGTLNPQWMNGSVSSMNVPRINSSMGYYENGGFIPGKSASDTSAQMMALLQNLNQQLSSPLIANVIYGQYEAKASAIDAIRKAGMVN